MIPQVVASERGGAQTGTVQAAPGLKDQDVGRNFGSRTAWKSRAERVRPP